MALIFADSFDSYTDLNTMYEAVDGGCSINNTGTESRTGLGCAVLGQSLGMTKLVPAIVGTGPTHGLVVGAAVYFPAGTASSGSAWTFLFNGFNQDLCAIGNTVDGAIEAFSFGVGSIGQSADGLVIPNAYNYLEVKVFFDPAVGSMTVKLNGVQVLHAVGNTLPFGTAAANTVKFNGVGGIAGARFDDLYILDTSGAANNDFLGAVRNYAILPNGNSSPLQWTPLSGTNFSEVNQNPPGGDAAYVSDGTVGNIDQYTYDTSGVPGGMVIFGAVHFLDGRQVTGSGSIASCVNGTAAASVALANNYFFVVRQAYDTNPHTGAPWSLTDFPATVLGPKLTA